MSNESESMASLEEKQNELAEINHQLALVAINKAIRAANRRLMVSQATKHIDLWRTIVALVGLYVVLLACSQIFGW